MSGEGARFGVLADYPPLPAGRHPLPRDFVETYQRQRLMVAVAEVVHEGGLGAVTVSGLCSRARVSRKTFYEHFGNRRECIEQASEIASGFIFAGLEAGLARAPRGEETRVSAAVGGLLGAIAAEPNLAELALVHAPALGGDAGRRFQKLAIEAIAELVESVEGAGGGSAEGRRPGTETIAIAILGVIAHWVRRGTLDRRKELGEEVVRLARLAAVGVE